jgi:3-oxoadipate enol-lactonase
VTLHDLSGVIVEEQGESANAVLCIHGLGGSSNTWTPILPAFTTMRLVRFDLPGSGRSAVPDGFLSIDVYVESAVRVLDQLHIAAAHIIAHSMGTIVAQHLAVEHSHRVKSLALFGPLSAPTEVARAATKARATVARKGLAGMQEIADTVVKASTSAETKERRPVSLALIRESVMRQSSEGYARSCEALAAAQAAAVESISAPALLATGDEDGVGTPAGVKALAARIKGSQVHILPGCGHWATFEKPFECRVMLEKFYSN